MIRYECNDCGKIIEDEDNMVTHDIMSHQCEECAKKEKEESNEKSLVCH